MILLTVFLNLVFGGLFANGVTPFNQERSLPACPDKLIGKTAGARFKFLLPKKAVSKHVDDVDYRNYFIGFGKGKDRVWMRGGFGPHWSGGNPTKGWADGLVDVERRTWMFEKRNDRGVDIKGKTTDGKFS